MCVPGHQLHPSLLPPVQYPSLSRNHRPTPALIQLQGRRARGRTHTVRVHAPENGMTSVGGQGHVPSHANHLVTETVAVTALDVDAP